MNPYNFDNAPFGFALCELIYYQDVDKFDYTFISINKAFEDLLSLDYNQIINQKASDIFKMVKSNHLDFIKDYVQIAQNGGSKTVENYFGDSKKIFDVYIYSYDKNIFATLFIDITLKKVKISKNIHSYSNLLKIHRNQLSFKNRVFESSRIPIIIMDKKTFKYIDCNQAAVNIYGYTSKSEVLGKTPLDVSAPIQYDNTPSNQKALYYINKALKDGSVVFEWKHMRDDGTIWDAEVHLLKFTCDSKIFLQFSLIDITERKKFQNALIQEKERLSVTLKSIGDAVITTDNNGRIILMNTIAEELTGWKQSEALGAQFDQVVNFIDEKSSTISDNLINKVINTGGGIDFVNNTIICSKGNIKRFVEYSISPIKFENSIIGTIIVIRDITNRRKFLETIQKAQKIESLGVLAGGIAHDFNNLLTGIFGYIGIAILNTKDKKVKDSLQKAYNTIEQAHSLSNQLITFAKGGKPHKNHEPLSPFLEDTINFALSGSNITAKFNVSPDLFLNIDKNQIAQVISNIVINACQAMSNSGEIVVTAKELYISEDRKPLLNKGKYVVISIKDTGIGIRKDLINRVFEPFYTTKPKGHGLGLSMCYSIIKKHNGIIEIESEINSGTTVSIFLPSADKLENSDKKLISPKSKKHLKGGKILVMDDELFMQNILSKILNILGFQVVTASEGNTAVNKFLEAKNNNVPFDGLILDLTIPGGIDGVTTLKKIKEIDDKIIAFVISGYSNHPILSNPQEYGFTDIIKKPFTIEEIEKLFKKYF